MLYTAYLMLCMVGPLGSGGCAPAAAPLVFENQGLCEKYIAREVEAYKAGEGLEAIRPHIPSMKQGKLKIIGGCDLKLVNEWLGVDMPEVPALEIEDELLGKDGASL
jgi:hypothetical protein